MDWADKEALELFKSITLGGEIVADTDLVVQAIAIKLRIVSIQGERKAWADMRQHFVSKAAQKDAPANLTHT